MIEVLLIKGWITSLSYRHLTKDMRNMKIMALLYLIPSFPPAVFTSSTYSVTWFSKVILVKNLMRHTNWWDEHSNKGVSCVTCLNYASGWMSIPIYQIQISQCNIWASMSYPSFCTEAIIGRVLQNYSSLQSRR